MNSIEAKTDSAPELGLVPGSAKSDNFASWHAFLVQTNDDLLSEVRELRRYKQRMEWLHDCSTGCKDADGFEWGIYRVKWNEQGQAESVWQTNSDFSDLDAEMEREANACEGCGKPSTTSDSEGVRLCQECYEACPVDDSEQNNRDVPTPVSNQKTQ